MKSRIRFKLIGILLLASVLPLGLALIAAQTFGYRYYSRAQGKLFQVRAEQLAGNLSFAINSRVRTLTDWVALSPLGQIVAESNAAAPELSDAEFRAQIDQTEQRWPSLAASSDELRAFLEHPLAAELRAFQSIDPLFVEVFATDARGRLVAATEKTTDYWQADEDWWQRAWKVKFLSADVTGLQYDTSAGVYSVDVSIPIRDRARPAEEPVGVLKAVLNASPLLMGATPARGAGLQKVVLGDGRILAELGAARGEPLQHSISREAVARIDPVHAGWTIAPVESGGREVIGYAPLQLNGAGDGSAPIYAVVHERTDVALAPVDRQIALVTGAGAAIVLLFCLAGYWLAGRKLIAPLEALRLAARRIASTVKLDARNPVPHPLPELEPLHRIRSHDEIGELAGDFATMAARVLTYHERLESDLAAKTAAIEADLEMAREFQEALMPHSYPRVPSDRGGSAIGLDFHHIYQPASTVGGDFFDVLKLSDHRAGIFIADVMGHGARSALITAILRALLQNLAFGTDDPAQFLTTLNQHFHSIIRDSRETIFVSAFYVIIDTLSATAVCASAGHPSPFVASRRNGTVEPMLGTLRANPALGLFPHANYSKWTRPVQAGDLYVLFTDGLPEAHEASGEEFGPERMKAAIAAGLKNPGHEIGQSLVDAVHAFIAPAKPADDICLVTIDVLASLADSEAIAGERVARSI